jgi:hypothetical protein
MAGIGQKIKNVLHPGQKHANDGVYTESGLGANHTTGMAGAPMAGEMGTHNRGIGGGMGGDLVTNSVSSSSSSDSDIGERGMGIGGAGVAHNVAGNTVCETRTFTEVEDRPIMRERVERIIEHRPVEKQFVVETRPVGERELAEGVHYESAGVREYEVDRVAGSKCPTTTGAGAGTNTVL